MDKKRILLGLVIAVLGIGSLSFLKYKSIATEQKLEITVLKAELKTKESTIVELQNNQAIEVSIPAEEPTNGAPAQQERETVDNTVSGSNEEKKVVTKFLIALYETASNNLTTRFEAVEPYLTGDALESLKPAESNVISNDDGYSTTTLSDIRIYTNDIDESHKEMAVFYTMTQDIIDPPIESNMIMTLLLARQNDAWKIIEIYQNKGY